MQDNEDEILIKLTNDFFESMKNYSIDKIITINYHEMQVEGWLKAELAHFIKGNGIFKNLQTEKKVDPTKKKKVDLYFELPSNTEVWMELKFWIGIQKKEKYPLSTTYLPVKANYIKNDLNKMLENQSRFNYFFIFYSNPNMEIDEVEEDIKKGLKKIRAENEKYNLNLLKLFQYNKIFSILLLKFIKN
ncbi:hypothetical protein P3G55_20990 [Leptospira sp. 96542]|nr:hypothetical protein [Leptospira sp. 96542]